jgi:Mn-dependent DtxR family transcriptional regulator
MSSGPKTRGAYGPTSPRGKAATQKQAAAIQAVKDQDMAKKMREAYENFQKSPEADTIGMKKGGMASSVSRRADGIAKKGKTRCKMV